MKRFQIIRNYKINGQLTPCLCTDDGILTIVYGEELAKAQVEKLHARGYTDAYCEELPQGQAWFDNENWIG